MRHPASCRARQALPGDGRGTPVKVGTRRIGLVVDVLGDDPHPVGPVLGMPRLAVQVRTRPALSITWSDGAVTLTGAIVARARSLAWSVGEHRV